MKARLSEGYRPDFDLDLTYGKKGEVFVRDYLNGLLGDKDGRLTVEVKSDRQWLNTGNVWIEVECKRSDGWHDSGIRASKADHWTLVLADTVLLSVPTPVLRRIADKAWADISSYGKPLFRSEERDGSHPTRGVRLSTAYFLTLLRIELAQALREAAA